MGEPLREPTRPRAVIFCNEPVTREMVQQTLLAEGYDVRVASGERELTRHGGPALVVVDERSIVELPEGIDTPTIVLMSAASPMTWSEAREVGLVNAVSSVPLDYLPFPFSPLELGRSARRVRRISRLRSHLPPTPALEIPANA